MLLSILVDLQAAAGLNVQFHVGASRETLLEIMKNCLVQWHLTGVEREDEDDPASEEHFGIAVAEGKDFESKNIIRRMVDVTLRDSVIDQLFSIFFVCSRWDNHRQRSPSNR